MADRDDRRNEQQLQQSSSGVTFASDLPKRPLALLDRCRPTAEFVKNFVTVTFLILWLIGGMFVFYLVEHPAEQARLNAEMTTVPTTTVGEIITTIDIEGQSASDIIRFVFQQYVTNYEIVNLTNSTLVVRLVPNSLLHNLTTNTGKGVCEPTPTLPKWDLSGSIFFCITVVTTIGYGNYAPSTDIGRVICVIFATVGIPLTLIVVSMMSKLLTKLSDRIARTMTRCFKVCRFRRPLVMPDPGDEHEMLRYRKKLRRRRRLTALISTLIISLIGIIIFLLLPSILFSSLEKWDYVTALYYGYITLSTIGFGDFVAGQTETPYFELYRLFLSFWIFFGMAFVATFISSMQSLIDKMTKDSVEKIQTRISQVKLSIGGGSRLTVTSPNNYADETARGSGGEKASVSGSSLRRTSAEILASRAAATVHRPSLLLLQKGVDENDETNGDETNSVNWMASSMPPEDQQQSSPVRRPLSTSLPGNNDSTRQLASSNQPAADTIAPAPASLRADVHLASMVHSSSLSSLASTTSSSDQSDDDLNDLEPL